MGYAVLALIFSLVPAMRADAAVTGERSPFYFADDTLKNRKKRKAAGTPAPKKGRTAPRGPIETSPEKRELLGERYLRPGKYRIEIVGIICNACTKAVIENLQDIRGVASAEFNFEKGDLILSIKKAKVKKGKRIGRNPARAKARVRVSKIRRAVQHAGRRVKLGTQLRVKSIRAK